MATKTRKERAAKSADEVILRVLVWEFACDDPKEAERKIGRRLRYYGLGPYQRARVDLLRRLKNETQSEIQSEIIPATLLADTASTRPWKILTSIA